MEVGSWKNGVPMDNLTRDAKIKAAEDEVNRLLENMSRLKRLILLKHLPTFLNLRSGSDLDYEISNECRKD